MLALCRKLPPLGYPLDFFQGNLVESQKKRTNCIHFPPDWLPSEQTVAALVSPKLPVRFFKPRCSGAPNHKFIRVHLIVTIDFSFIHSFFYVCIATKKNFEASKQEEVVFSNHFLSHCLLSYSVLRDIFERKHRHFTAMASSSGKPKILRNAS